MDSMKSINVSLVERLSSSFQCLNLGYFLDIRFVLCTTVVNTSSLFGMSLKRGSIVIDRIKNYYINKMLLKLSCYMRQ